MIVEQGTTETESMQEFAIVTRAVSSLYREDKPYDYKKNRYILWHNVAEKNPRFAGQIRSLNQELDLVYEIIKNHEPQTIIPESHFKNVESEEARALLEDILFARTRIFKKYHNCIDISSITEEAAAMAGEMRFKDWKSEGVNGVTLERVIGQVLLDKLRITYQPHQRGIFPFCSR